MDMRLTIEDIIILHLSVFPLPAVIQQYSNVQLASIKNTAKLSKLPYHSFVRRALTVTYIRQVTPFTLHTNLTKQNTTACQKAFFVINFTYRKKLFRISY